MREPNIPLTPYQRQIELLVQAFIILVLAVIFFKILIF